MSKKLYIVVPCYNEEKVLEITTKKLNEKLGKMISDRLVDEKSRILYVDDGSKDNTWNLIKKLCDKNKLVSGMKLSRNRGHQNALLAGLMIAKDHSDMVISMDADLQDDIDAMDEFIKEYNNGCDIVYGVRKSRKKDTFFKKNTALMFYKLMNFLGADIVYNHADYRLMSKRALNELSKFKEVNLFLRGIIPLIGFKTAKVYYERKERAAGESKYPLKKMISFAFEGILSFSVKPIKMITNVGITVSILSFIYFLYVIISHLILKNAQPGWTTIIALICLFGGVQILCIGIIGEYVGKIYSETKQRPKYILDEIILKEKNND